jgi:hypothetical protein
MNSMHATNKPFNIDKRLVYEAYKAVKSNRGAAGVDEQTIEQFEADLSGNRVQPQEWVPVAEQLRYSYRPEDLGDYRRGSMLDDRFAPG